MRRLFAIFLCLAALVLAVSTVSPRSAAAQSCDFSTVVDLAHALTNNSSVADIQAVDNAYHDALARCYGYTFQGTNTRILDSFDLPKGAYKMHISAHSYGMGVTLNAVTGACTVSNGHYFSATHDNNVIDDEGLVLSQGCRVVLQVSLVEGDWTIKFQPIAG